MNKDTAPAADPLFIGKKTRSQLYEMLRREIQLSTSISVKLSDQVKLREDAERRCDELARAAKANGHALEDVQVAIRAFVVERCPHAANRFRDREAGMYGYVDSIESEIDPRHEADARMLEHLYRMARK